MPLLAPLDDDLAAWRAASSPPSGPTVPALEIGGRRIRGSRETSRALDELRPRPHLFPEAPGLRREVEAAKRWGEEVLQAVPRRIFRWVTANRLEVRRWLAAERVPLPGSALLARSSLQARAFARAVRASDETVCRDIAGLDGLLSRASSLREDGVIGGARRTRPTFRSGARSGLSSQTVPLGYGSG